MNTEIAIDVLGHLGRMISGSKSSYCRRNPDNHVVFNANVCTDQEKIWYGDLDITLDNERLQQLADELGHKIYVLTEHDARFSNEKAPLLENAVAIYEPNNV